LLGSGVVPCSVTSTERAELSSKLRGGGLTSVLLYSKTRAAAAKMLFNSSLEI